MKRNEGRSYGRYTISILVAAFLVYRIWQFARRPDALEQTLEFLGGAALCIAAPVLFMAVLLLVPYLAAKLEKKPLPRPTDFHYKVDTVRTKPDFDTREAWSQVGVGVLSVATLLGAWYLLIDGLMQTFGSTHEIGDVRFFLKVCGSSLGVLLALAAAAVPILMGMIGMATLVRYQTWLGGAARARAAIVDRQEKQIVIGSDKYGEYTGTAYELILHVDDHPEVPELDGRFIRADVSKRVFRRYTRKRTAVIHYAPDSPLTFVLQGE